MWLTSPSAPGTHRVVRYGSSVVPSIYGSVLGILMLTTVPFIVSVQVVVIAPLIVLAELRSLGVRRATSKALNGSAAMLMDFFRSKGKGTIGESVFLDDGACFANPCYRAVDYDFSDVGYEREVTIERHGSKTLIDGQAVKWLSAPPDAGSDLVDIAYSGSVKLKSGASFKNPFAPVLRFQTSDAHRREVNVDAHGRVDGARVQWIRREPTPGKARIASVRQSPLNL